MLSEDGTPGVGSGVEGEAGGGDGDLLPCSERPRRRGATPSQRYLELIALHRTMHAAGRVTTEGTAARSPRSYFEGFSLLGHVARIKSLVDRTAARRLLDYGSGKGRQYESFSTFPQSVRRPEEVAAHESVLRYWGVDSVRCYDPAVPQHAELPAGSFDGVVCTDVLEHCPEADLPWIVEELFALAERFLFVHVACLPARKSLPDGSNAHSTLREPSWWSDLFRSIAVRHTNLRYELVCSNERSHVSVSRPDLSSFPRRRLGVTEVPGANGDVVLRAGKDKLGALNPTALRIWELCDGTFSVKAIAHRLAGEIGTLGLALFEDVAATVAELERIGVLSVERRDLPPVRVFVGTEPFMNRAEVALEYSIRANTTGPVEIEWMDHGRGGPWAGWNIGRQRGVLSKTPDPSAWATEFSCFRFAIPEVSGFRGRAIYLDADMVVLGDLRPLVDGPAIRPVLATETGIATLVFDCERFAGQPWWPSLKAMQPSGWTIAHYTRLLQEQGWLVPGLGREYNCLDGEGFTPGKTVVLHYTHRNTQPWKPHPEVFDYPAHKSPELENLWWELYEMAGGDPREA